MVSPAPQVPERAGGPSSTVAVVGGWIGALALLFAWVPFWGLLALPLALLAAVLGMVGFSKPGSKVAAGTALVLAAAAGVAVLLMTQALNSALTSV